MNRIGYTLTGHDNDTFMFEDDSCLEKCPTCGYRLDFLAFNPKYRLKRKGRSLDISTTYDGQYIVSVKFREICDGIPGLVFNAFDDEPGFFHLLVINQITFDHERAKTRFINKCQTCGNYESIVGTSPAFFRIASTLPFGIFRSDLMFASGNEKHPLIVVSVDVYDLLNASALKGLVFSPAYGS